MATLNRRIRVRTDGMLLTASGFSASFFRYSLICTYFGVGMVLCFLLF